MAGVVHIPWYATGFRGDRLEEALGGVAAAAMRYGATAYSVYRFRDDRYKFIQMAQFEDKMDFERYWFGPEFTDFRVLSSGWYQVPVVYGWTDLVASGSLPAAHSVTVGTGNGGGEPTGDLAG